MCCSTVLQKALLHYRHTTRSAKLSNAVNLAPGPARIGTDYLVKFSGAKETRTPDPLHAMQVLYQLSYGPRNDGKE